MPSKVNPAPKSTSGASKPRKSKLFNTARFTAATSRIAKDFSDIARERGGQGTLSSAIFIAFLGCGFVALGLYLIIHGDENYIVDLIVLGGLLLAMGVGTLVLGFVVVVVPIFKERRRRKVSHAEAAPSTTRPRSPSIFPAVGAQASSAFPAAVVVVPNNRAAGGHHASSSSSSSAVAGPSRTAEVPADTVLYDRDSLNAVPDNDRRGKLAPPPPPAISLVPSENEPTDADKDASAILRDLEDVSTQSDDNISYV